MAAEWDIAKRMLFLNIFVLQFHDYLQISFHYSFCISNMKRQYVIGAFNEAWPRKCEANMSCFFGLNTFIDFSNHYSEELKFGENWGERRIFVVPYVN